MDRPNFDHVLEVMAAKGYPIREPEGQEIRLNIAGVRGNDRESNKFDDWLIAFYRDGAGGPWITRPAPATTDPGLPYRLKPMNHRGTAILLPGHYHASHCTGSHRGTNGFVQEGFTPVKIALDNNLDGILDIEGMQVIEGWFGINLHGPHSVDNVDYSSAGCQVWQQREMVEYAYRVAQAGVGVTDPRFPGRQFQGYTLITEADLAA